jgi:hypothetical protein
MTLIRSSDDPSAAALMIDVVNRLRQVGPYGVWQQCHHDPGLIATATVGASRGIIEYELRFWPVAATVTGMGLSVAVQVLADRPQVLVASAAAQALLAIVLAERRPLRSGAFRPDQDWGVWASRSVLVSVES